MLPICSSRTAAQEEAAHHEKERDETELHRHPECFQTGGASESRAQLSGRAKSPSPLLKPLSERITDLSFKLGGST